MHRRKTAYSGFTLVEISIVLVIIGLIVGGVLVGRDLIRAAETRATISQIEKFNTAANTFREKYGYLPGDINVMAAAQFGFAARGQYAGEGDGNGIIEGVLSNAPGENTGFDEIAGETAMFWVDLSTAHFIDSSFNTANSTTQPGGNITGAAIGNYLPSAKLGMGNYLYVWSWNGVNYYGLAAMQVLFNTGGFNVNPAITVAQAYAIDKKIDDDLPQSGNVMAMDIIWPGGTGWAPTTTTAILGAAPGTAAAGSASTCYDNNNNATALMNYSVEINNGAGVNCELSFKMQAGD